jgi:hypothetical protein
LIAEYLEASPPSARLEAIESLTGEALLRMVHTRDGAWVANAVLCYGTAKDCKKFVKAMKGEFLIVYSELNMDFSQRSPNNLGTGNSLI